MIKKVLLSLTVFACILLPKGIYASEETSSNAQMCGLEYQKPHVVDESVAKEYEAAGASAISCLTEHYVGTGSICGDGKASKRGNFKWIKASNA